MNSFDSSTEIRRDFKVFYEGSNYIRKYAGMADYIFSITFK